MVAGLIEQQQVGLAQQGTPYLQAAVLATAQGTDRQCRLFAQLQFGQHLVHLPVEAGVECQGFCQHVAGTECLQLRGQMLGHELAAAGGGSVYASVMGRDLAGEQGEQGALATAIGADEADAVTALDAEIESVE
ncbi:hypothetical protein D3C85_1542900 [compost metagenome]